MKTIEVIITETGRNTLKDEPRAFNEERAIFKNLDAVKEYLIDRYGKLPKMNAKVDKINLLEALQS